MLKQWLSRDDRSLAVIVLTFLFRKVHFKKGIVLFCENKYLNDNKLR